MINKRWRNREYEMVVGVLYAGFVLVLGAYFNYTIPYDPSPIIFPDAIQFVLLILLYIPLGLMLLVAGWKVSDFGFHINSKLGLAALVIISLCMTTGWSMQIPWQSAFFEAVARTGEEIFFRGFLFVLLMKIFSGKSKPWIWAIFISTLLFSLVHTQTFQSSFLEKYGSMPVIYKVIERLSNIFLMGLLLAFLRHWTNSILPGAIIHSILQSGVLALPFCLGIYGVIVLWAILKGENIY